MTRLSESQHVLRERTEVLTVALVHTLSTREVQLGALSFASLRNDLVAPILCVMMTLCLDFSSTRVLVVMFLTSMSLQYRTEKVGGALLAACWPMVWMDAGRYFC